MRAFLTLILAVGWFLIRQTIFYLWLALSYICSFVLPPVTCFLGGVFAFWIVRAQVEWFEHFWSAMAVFVFFAFCAVAGWYLGCAIAGAMLLSTRVDHTQPFHHVPDLPVVRRRQYRIQESV